MNGFLRRLLNYDTVDVLLQIGVGYQEVVKEQGEKIDNLERQLQALRLEHTRNLRDLVEHFFIAQEAGLDVRDELEAGLRDLQDEVARQEEHVR